MKLARLCVVVVSSSLAAVAMGAAMLDPATSPSTAPSSQPSTRAAEVAYPHDVWLDRPLGRLMFHAFATAPFPHESRADGWKNSAGSVFSADHYRDSTVGLFVPRGYTPGNAVDLVFYFHGHNNHVSRVIDTFKLEAQFAKSAVNAILVVPQGPLDVPDSAGGKLERDDDAFKRFVTDVIAYLKTQGIEKNDRIGNIVLAAHSGGYLVTASILHRGGLTDHITDVVLLDASYGGLQWFAEFAKAQPTARIISFHTKHLDDENLALAGLLEKAGVPHREVAEDDLSSASLSPRGVTFVSTSLAHNDVPSAKDYLAICLAGAQLEKRADTSPVTQPTR